MTMRYSQFRMAKRNGEIVWQHRYVHCGDTYKIQPWWKFWNQEYTYDKTYGEWEDLPIEEVGNEATV